MAVALPFATLLPTVGARWRRQLPAPGGVCAMVLIRTAPTASGCVFFITLAILLTVAVRQNLNGGYLLAFTAATVMVASVYPAFWALLGLRLRALPPRSVFAGDPLHVDVVFEVPGTSRRARRGLELDGGLTTERFDWPRNARQVGASRVITTTFATVRRGVLTLPRLRVRTFYPLGLWCAAVHWTPGVRVLIYPRPEPSPPPLPISSNGAPAAAAHDSTLTHGEGDATLNGLRPYRVGDRAGRIAWNIYAKTDGQVLGTRDFAGAEQPLHLTPELARAAGDSEAVISRLAAWIVVAEAAGIAYGLSVGDVPLAPSLGPEHQAACLTQLALLPSSRGVA